jgi:hypothetical protein
METLPSKLAPKELSGQEADQQRSKHTTSRSLNMKKSLLVKQKSSAVNAPKPPTEKRRKSSASNVQFVRSPILNRILASPRTRHSKAKHQRSHMQDCHLQPYPMIQERLLLLILAEVRFKLLCALSFFILNCCFNVYKKTSIFICCFNVVLINTSILML